MQDKRRRKRKQMYFIAGGALLLGVVMFLLVMAFFNGNQQQASGIYKDPTYVSPFIDDIAQHVHLVSSELKSQTLAGKSMADIAAEQGLSATQLQTIELNAFQHLFDRGVQNGVVTQQDEAQTLQQYRADPQLLNNKTYQLITGTSS